MNLPCKPDRTARAVVALFIAAIAAGYGTADLWQMTWLWRCYWAFGRDVSYAPGQRAWNERPGLLPRRTGSVRR